MSDTTSTAAAGAAVGSVVPGVGTAIGGVIGTVAGSVSSLFSIKGSTQHLDWNTANTWASSMGAKIQNAVIAACGADNEQKIAVAFTARLITFLQNTTRWQGSTVEPNPLNDVKAAYAQMLQNQIYQHIGHIFWSWGIWASRNVDVTSTTELQNDIINDMGQTLYPAITDVMGKDALDPVVAGTSTANALSTLSSIVPVTATSVAGNPAINPAIINSVGTKNPAAVVPSTPSTAGLSLTTIILVVGAGVGLMFFAKKAA